MCHRRGSLLTKAVPGPYDFKTSPTVSLIPWWWWHEEVQRGLLCTGHAFLRGMVLGLASSRFPLQDFSAMWTPGFPAQRLDGTYAEAAPNPHRTWRHPSDAHFSWPSIFSHWNFCVPTAWEHLIFIIMSFLQMLAKTSICLVWITHSLSCQCKRHKRCRFDPWVWKIPWRRTWKSTPVFLPGETHGQRSPVCYSPWGHTESDMPEAT